MSLAPGTYSLWVEADSETMVLNSSVTAVPEPAAGSVLAGGFALALLTSDS